MGELIPKITVNEKWGNFSLQVDIDCPYTEDYQMKMLGHNIVPGILQVKGYEADKKSRYVYRTQGMTRLSCKYETEEIGRDGICTLLEQVMAAADELKRHLLDPDCLLLAPECIFEKDDRYGFCYIPVRVKPLCRSLHELTEFFLEKLDYRDTEGVFLACLLHKETLKEGYDLAEILRKYKADEAARLHAPGKGGSTGGKGRGKSAAEAAAAAKEAGPSAAGPSAAVKEAGTSAAGTSAAAKEAGPSAAGPSAAAKEAGPSAAGTSAEEDRDLLIVDEEGTGVRGYCVGPGKTAYSSYITESAPMFMREEGKKYGPLKKLGRRLKTGYWGNWSDLITEAKEDEHQPA